MAAKKKTIMGRDAFAEFSATDAANLHLAAYKKDRNPDHIFNAYLEYLNYGVPHPAEMGEWMRRAIAERHTKNPGNPPRNTLRRIEVMRYLAARYGPNLPAKLIAADIQHVAMQYGVTTAAAKTELSRLRKALRERRPKPMKLGNW